MEKGTTATLADITALEKENRELQQKVGQHDRQILVELRAIALRNQNRALRETVAAPKPMHMSHGEVATPPTGSRDDQIQRRFQAHIRYELDHYASQLAVKTLRKVLAELSDGETP